MTILNVYTWIVIFKFNERETQSNTKWTEKALRVRIKLTPNEKPTTTVTTRINFISVELLLLEEKNECK